MGCFRGLSQKTMYSCDRSNVMTKHSKTNECNKNAGCYQQCRRWHPRKWITNNSTPIWWIYFKDKKRFFRKLTFHKHHRLQTLSPGRCQFSEDAAATCAWVSRGFGHAITSTATTITSWQQHIRACDPRSTQNYILKLRKTTAKQTNCPNVAVAAKQAACGRREGWLRRRKEEDIVLLCAFFSAASASILLIANGSAYK